MSDTLAPNAGLTLDAAGNVTYEFEGRLKAHGIDIDADVVPPGESPVADSRVQWLAQADGGRVASVEGLQSGADTTTADELSGKLTAFAYKRALGGTETAQATLGVRDTVTEPGRTLISDLFSWAPGGGGRALMASISQPGAGTLTKKLLDADGISDWLLQPGGQSSGGGWTVLPMVWATWYGSGWPQPRWRRIGKDIVQMQGLFKMPADAAPQGNKQEAFDMTGLQPDNGTRMVWCLGGPSGSNARFDITAGTPHLRWMNGGAAGDWFWLNTMYVTSGPA